MLDALSITDEFVERTSVGQFIVTNSSAALLAVADERAVDVNGDTKFDKLEFDFAVDVIVPGRL